MAVVAYREVSGRSLSHRFGEAPTAELKYAITLDNPATSQQEILNSVGIFHGSFHPEYTYLRCIEGTVTENDPDPYHATATYRYELPVGGTDAFDVSPLARPDIWSFSTGGAAVPALFWFDGNTMKPLVNAVNELFEGFTTDEAECRATITANRATFPLATAIAVTNTLNASAYLGAPAHHWKCAGIAGQQQTEVVNGVEVRYWAITTELIYRQTGWPLQIAHTGYNYLDGSEKKKAMVYDDENEMWIPAVTPQALNADGTLKASNVLPDILVRRVNRETNFQTYFGTPSWL